MYKTVLLEDLKILDNQLKSVFDKPGIFQLKILKTTKVQDNEEHLYHCYLVKS